MSGKLCSSVVSFKGGKPAVEGFESDRRKRISLFHGWSFIRFKEGPIETSYPVMPIFDYDCPTIQIDPTTVTHEQLENPHTASIWLPMAIWRICHTVLLSVMEEDAGGEARLKGQGWANFLEEVCRLMGVNRKELVQHTLMNGFEETVEFMTENVFFESGLAASLTGRMLGKSSCKLAV